MAANKIGSTKTRSTRKTGGFFQFEITGSESIGEEVNDGPLKELGTIIPQYLRGLRSNVALDLHDITYPEIYERYDPKQYKRRAFNPGYGEQIGSGAYLKSMLTNNRNLVFDYNPSGEYRGAGWSRHRGGDDLIEVIEMGEYYPIYTPKDENGQIIPRPYWTELVMEYTDMGYADEILVKFANGRIKGFNMIYDGNIRRNANDDTFNEEVATQRIAAGISLFDSVAEGFDEI